MSGRLWLAFALFVVAMITDLCDGYLARRSNSVTELDSDERLAKFTAYVDAILKLDPETLPKGLKKNLDELRRNLEMWAGPASPEGRAGLG